MNWSRQNCEFRSRYLSVGQVDQLMINWKPPTESENTISNSILMCILWSQKYLVVEETITKQKKKRKETITWFTFVSPSKSTFSLYRQKPRQVMGWKVLWTGTMRSLPTFNCMSIDVLQRGIFQTWVASNLSCALVVLQTIKFSILIAIWILPPLLDQKHPL